MIDSIINHMDADELRNLVVHLQKVNEAEEQLRSLDYELIECLQRLYNHQLNRESGRIFLDIKIESLRKVEQGLKEKYKEYLPVPVSISDTVHD